jgi:membrane protein involved in colicin uptake
MPATKTAKTTPATHKVAEAGETKPADSKAKKEKKAKKATKAATTTAAPAPEKKWRPPSKPSPFSRLLQREPHGGQAEELGFRAGLFRKQLSGARRR